MGFSTKLSREGFLIIYECGSLTNISSNRQGYVGQEDYNVCGPYFSSLLVLTI